MHRSYDISNDDLRYVLATFVVTPDPLDRPVRLAPDDGGRADRRCELLPRPRPAHGHPGHPRRPGRRSPAASTPTSVNTSASTSAPAAWPRRPSSLLATFPPNDRLPRGRRPADLVRDHGRPAARRVRLPAPVPGRSGARAGRDCRPAAASSAFCPHAAEPVLRPPAAADPQLSRTATRWPSSGTVPAGLPGPRPHRNPRAPPRQSEASPERDVAVSRSAAMVLVPGNDAGAEQGVVTDGRIDVPPPPASRRARG